MYSEYQMIRCIMGLNPFPPVQFGESVWIEPRDPNYQSGGILRIAKNGLLHMPKPKPLKYPAKKINL